MKPIPTSNANSEVYAHAPVKLKALIIYTTSKKPEKHIHMQPRRNPWSTPTYVTLKEPRECLHIRALLWIGADCMTEKSGQSEHFFLVSDLSGFFLLCCTIHFIRALYVCASWASQRLHIFMSFLGYSQTAYLHVLPGFSKFNSFDAFQYDLFVLLMKIRFV